MTWLRPRIPQLLVIAGLLYAGAVEPSGTAARVLCILIAGVLIMWTQAGENDA